MAGGDHGLQQGRKEQGQLRQVRAFPIAVNDAIHRRLQRELSAMAFETTQRWGESLKGGGSTSTPSP